MHDAIKYINESLFVEIFFFSAKYFYEYTKLKHCIFNEIKKKYLIQFKVHEKLFQFSITN